MAIFQVHRLVGVAFAAALCWRLGDRGSALLALGAVSLGWLLEWRALADLSLVRGIDSVDVLRDRHAKPSALAWTLLALGALAVVLAMCGVGLGLGLSRMAVLGAGLMALVFYSSRNNMDQ